MMRRRLAIWGATGEALRLLRLLSGNPEVEVTRIWDSDPASALARARQLSSALAHHVAPLLLDDPDAFFGEPDFHAVVDALGDFASRIPVGSSTAFQVVTPLTARLLWGYGVHTRDRKAELLQALHEVVESVDLTVDSDELFERMLEIAIGVTGAEGGSLMLLDPASQRLRIRVARGVEPELWPKISVALGQGIAGRVAAEARPIHLRGKADATQFDLLRERVDVESALSLPLIHQGRVLGVINVHHPHRADVFSPEDIRFMEQLASLDAQIIARAQEHESLRSQAARYDAIREVQQLLRGPVVLEERLEDFCRFVSERAGGGIAQIFLAESDGSFRLCATSLAAGGLGGEYRIDDASGVDGQAIRARRPIWLRHEDGRLGYAALPLLAGHKMMGLLSIQLGREQSTPLSARFSWEEISAAAADAIARSDKEARMAARSERTQALNESSIRMLSCDDPNEVARLATSAAATLLDADHVVLRLQDPITRRYSIRSYSGAAEGPERESLFRLDKAVSVDTIHRSAVHRIPNASLDPRLAEFADSMRPVLAAPLQRDRQVIGTLSVYDKVALDRFLPSDFDEEDLQLFRRFASYVERALDHALSHQDSRQHRNFDEETGLANAGFLDKRLNEEISRAAGRENALALCVCRLENRSELLSESGPAHVGRVVALLAEALRTHVRPFDVLARLDLDEFAVLMPEPGRTPGERVFELARAVADTVSKHETLNQPVRIGLAFGYGVHPADGDDREALLHHARDPRIRMV